MEIKAKALEGIINKSIEDIKRGPWSDEAFAVHEEGGVQVQIVITKDSEQFCSEILPEYVAAPSE